MIFVEYWFVSRRALLGNCIFVFNFKFSLHGIYTLAEGCSLEKKFAERHDVFLMFDVEFVCLIDRTSHETDSRSCAS